MTLMFASQLHLNTDVTCIENVSSNITSCEKHLPCIRYIDAVPFFGCGISTKIPRKLICDWWRIFHAFVSTCAIAFSTTHWRNKTCGFDTDSFVPVSSLCGVVGLPSWFTKCLIGRSGNIWSVVYINAKCTYIFRNLCVHHNWMYNSSQYPRCHFNLDIKFMMVWCR